MSSAEYHISIGGAELAGLHLTPISSTNVSCLSTGECQRGKAGIWNRLKSWQHLPNATSGFYASARFGDATDLGCRSSPPMRIEIGGPTILNSTTGGVI